MQTVTLSNETANSLRQVAALRGVDPDTYADELLSISLAVLREGIVTSSSKPHHAMEFSGIAPTGRSAAEINADIEAARAEWDDDTHAAFSNAGKPA